MKLFSFVLLPIFLMTITALRVYPQRLPNGSIIGRGQMPSVESDNKGIYLVYGIGDSLVFQSSADRGRSFSRMQVITTLPGLNSSATRGPQIVATGKGLCVVASTGAGNIYSFVQRPSGGWSAAKKVTDRDSVDLEGFVSLAGDGHSSLFAVWPDLRLTGQNKIYGARSLDGGRTWSKNEMVYASPDTTVCQCCKPTVVMSGDEVYVMFRNWLHGNRDLYLTQSSDKGRSFGKAQKLGMESWALNGCPMDGGSLVVDARGSPFTVWNRKGTIYSCEPGKREIPLGQGRGCTMTIANGRKIYAWVENNHVTVMTPNGTKKIIGTGHSPALKAVGNDSVLCVWEVDKQLQYEVVDL
jgi:hypothetical protein